MFFESSLEEETKFIANRVPKLSSEPRKKTMALIQFSSVNIKICKIFKVFTATCVDVFVHRRPRQCVSIY